MEASVKRRLESACKEGHAHCYKIHVDRHVGTLYGGITHAHKIWNVTQYISISASNLAITTFPYTHIIMFHNFHAMSSCHYSSLHFVRSSPLLHEISLDDSFSHSLARSLNHPCLFSIIQVNLTSSLVLACLPTHSHLHKCTLQCIISLIKRLGFTKHLL